MDCNFDSRLWPEPPRRIIPKTKFTKEEDTLIMQLVHHFGDENWALIASKVKGRSTRQCRERYKNYLSPTINNSPWTQDEEDLLYEKYSIYGPKWKLIADFFKNRTDINIKNHWLKLERQKRRGFKELDSKMEIHEHTNPGNDHLSSPEPEDTIELQQKSFNQEHTFSNQTHTNQNYQYQYIHQLDKPALSIGPKSCNQTFKPKRQNDDSNLVKSQFAYAGDYWCSFAEPLLQAFEFDYYQDMKPDMMKLLQKVGIT